MTGQMDHASNPRGRRKAREGERRMHAERQQATTTDAELARLRDGAQMLGRIVAQNNRVMEAARIEMRQNGPHAAMQWILNSLADLWDGPEETVWDGKEPAQAWFDRTEAAYQVAGPRSPAEMKLSAVAAFCADRMNHIAIAGCCDNRPSGELVRAADILAIISGEKP